jgi:hypothetical protein
MLQYLSGIGIGKSAKRIAKQEKKAITVTKKQAKKSNLTPVTKSRINKLQVQSKIRKAFVKKAEPIKVTEEEVIEEVQQPVEEETPTEEVQAEEQAEQRESEDADLGIYYPMGLGKSKGKLKKAVKKAGAKIKKATTNIKKNLNKDIIAHNIAKVSLVLPRGAFLTILALGKALKDTPVKINLAREIVNVWKSKGEQIKKLWYKMGGETSELIKAINKSEKSNISGNMGVVVATTVAASIATATPIMLKINEILKKGKDFAEKNPKLVAAGNKILKGAIDKAQQKSGVTPEQVDALNDIANTVKKAIPQKAVKSVATAQSYLTTKDIKTVEQQASADSKDIETSSGSTKSNKTIMIVGGVALLGAFFLLKRKK